MLDRLHDPVSAGVQVVCVYTGVCTGTGMYSGVCTGTGMYSGVCTGTGMYSGVCCVHRLDDNSVSGRMEEA